MSHLCNGQNWMRQFFQVCRLLYHHLHRLPPSPPLAGEPPSPRGPAGQPPPPHSAQAADEPREPPLTAAPATSPAALDEQEEQVTGQRGRPPADVPTMALPVDPVDDSTIPDDIPDTQPPTAPASPARQAPPGRSSADVDISPSESPPPLPDPPALPTAPPELISPIGIGQVLPSVGSGPVAKNRCCVTDIVLSSAIFSDTTG